ncbi:TonB-dependent receptor [Marinicauda pacifica]|uniref:TonB-dependent receptor n=1 Tax=Marinicauda pacifica TaxID=1133559 RepID=A0A4S2HF27_9PROT|nr:TonB-dependent receptor [Marinicauda pacifica]GGE37710.1 TonB-dependent receptor [Marinicauda pacifica]
MVRKGHGAFTLAGRACPKLVLLTTVACLAAPAWAQDVPSDTPTDTQVARQDTILVTARRREESMQDVPVSVTAVSADDLERQGITNTVELDQIVPNLQFATYGTLTGNNSAAQVFIRGIGQTDATPAVDPGVGIYIDEVYMGRSVGGAMDFRDIASVQVLRGPQGTLFGRNTIGGAVLMSTNEPGAGNTLRLGVGEDNLYEGFIALDVPISEELEGRVSFGARQRDGYVTRAFDGVDLGNEDTWTAQGTVRWEPSPDVSFLLRGDYSKEDENGSPFVFVEINESQLFPIIGSVVGGCPGASFPPPTPVPMIDDPRCANDFQEMGPFTNGGTYPASSTLENGGLALTAEWDVSDTLTLKSITSARTLEWTGSRDADNTPLLVLHTNYDSESEQFSQEFQTLFDLGSVTGVAGVYYFDESSYDRLIVPLGTPGTSYDTQRVNLGTEAWAAFTDWTWDISDALSVGGGLRYTEEDKTIQGSLFNVAGVNSPEPPIPSTLCPFGGPPPTQVGCLFISDDEFTQSFSSLTGSASIQYRWTDTFMTYFRFAQGFKSGGFNQRYNAATPGNVPIAFDEETAESFEIGFKANPARGMRLNGAIFTTKYDDIQLTYRLGVVPLLFNAGEATIEGAELEWTWSPTADLMLDASMGYLDAGYDSINDPTVGGTNPTAVATLDSKLPFVPDWTWHVGASYTFHPTPDFELIPRIDVSFTDAIFFDAGNSTNIAADEVTLVNGSLTLVSLGSDWRLALHGHNLTDELYPVAGTSSTTTSSGYAEVINARPRNFTLSFTLDF